MADPAVSFTWAARMPRDAAAALDPLRLTPGLELLVACDEIWLRAAAPNAGTLAKVRAIPWREIYSVASDGALRIVGHFLPCGSLPDGAWRALTAAIAPTLPPPAQPIRPTSRVGLRLIDSTEWSAPNLVLTSPAAWIGFVETAAAVRLARLRFAQSQNGVIVRGNPLPALLGTHFVESGGIAIPVGTAVSPAVSTATIRAAFALGAGDFLVWNRDGEITRIPAEAWLPADRATVRLMNPTHAH